MERIQTKRLIAIMLTTTLALSLVPALSLAAQMEAQRMRDYVTIAEKVRQEVSRVRGLAASSGLDTTGADALLREADALLADARAALDRNDLQTAAEKARLAQERYREVVRTLGRQLGERAEPTAERARALESAISRTEQRLQRIRELAGRMPDISPVLAANVNNNLTIAERALASAKSFLSSSPPDVRSAAKSLGDANRALGQAMSSLQMAAQESQLRRAAQFLSSMMRTVEGLREQLSKASQQGIAVDDLQAKLAAVDPLLSGAKQKIDAGDARAAIENFKAVRNRILEIRQELAKRTAAR